LIEIIGAERHRLDGIVPVIVAGDNDDLGVRVTGEDLLQRCQSLGGVGRIRNPRSSVTTAGWYFCIAARAAWRSPAMITS